MKPIDKYGNQSYPKTFKVLQRHENKLLRLGYREAKRKPNLFFRNCKSVTFFADMRGTEEVPIWEDQEPLFYWHWESKNLSLTFRQRAVCTEWIRLSIISVRLSHELDFESAFEAQLIYGKTEESYYASTSND